MESQVIEIRAAGMDDLAGNPDWIAALEAGKVLHLPRLGFTVLPSERGLLSPSVRAPKARNISLDAQGRLKGGAGDARAQAALTNMIGRYREQALQVVNRMFPHYTGSLRAGPTSYRPMEVSTRSQSWRADDRRLHVDAFPTRPNYGERILRVFANVNPADVPRAWRVGEPFETVASRFLPRAKPYRPAVAKLLNAVSITKSLRSEYDHLMLQLHDDMKRDLAYQAHCPQAAVDFMPGSTWICFSDQTSHAAMSGQYMLEQTLYLPAGCELHAAASPIAILTRLMGHPLLGTGQGRAI